MPVLQPGELLEGTSYAIVRELGSGGMGVVYEIEHVRLNKRYVAKVLHAEVAAEEGAARRMEREAQVLAAISHPNIVQVHDVGVTPAGVRYFVMEKLEGADLRQHLRSARMPADRALELTIDVLDALAHVHERGIVHRDIKPENIFLARQGDATLTKVLDFGVVHMLDREGRTTEQQRLTKAGGFVGTLHYAAPEQMQGSGVGPPADVYAAALVLFELLAGKGPFDDDPGVGLSRCFKPAPSLLDVVPEASAEIAAAIAAALERDPSQRPTAAELAERLRAVVALPTSEPSREIVPSAPAPRVSTSPGLYATVDPALRSSVQRRRLALAASGVLVLLAIVVSAVVLRRRASTEGRVTATASIPVAASSIPPTASVAPPVETVAAPAPTPSIAATKPASRAPKRVAPAKSGTPSSPTVDMDGHVHGL